MLSYREIGASGINKQQLSYRHVALLIIHRYYAPWANMVNWRANASASGSYVDIASKSRRPQAARRISLCEITTVDIEAAANAGERTHASSLVASFIQSSRKPARRLCTSRQAASGAEAPSSMNLHAGHYTTESLLVREHRRGQTPFALRVPLQCGINSLVQLKLPGTLLAASNGQ